ncbi:hypothetical protein E2562_039025 [Oryza meyeriana var. granulata]|uniref:Uncharacterized protein n=1 Tax=Oryza meyeriana var. granulata TaxID=110450 RepID=A0A6G1CMI7_9ORYZ|nr:hypothetical protein E2562_039025 [Oryza meyeriana var. granulata]KAF0901287.1 hypothetical protein E2562_039025 [Oryza meyeriana var. granulata]
MVLITLEAATVRAAAYGSPSAPDQRQPRLSCHHPHLLLSLHCHLGIADIGPRRAVRPGSGPEGGHRRPSLPACFFVVASSSRRWLAPRRLLARQLRPRVQLGRGSGPLSLPQEKQVPKTDDQAH